MRVVANVESAKIFGASRTVRRLKAVILQGVGTRRGVDGYLAATRGSLLLAAGNAAWLTFAGVEDASSQCGPTEVSVFIRHRTESRDRRFDKNMQRAERLGANLLKPGARVMAHGYCSSVNAVRRTANGMVQQACDVRGSRGPLGWLASLCEALAWRRTVTHDADLARILC